MISNFDEFQKANQIGGELDDIRIKNFNIFQKKGFPSKKEESQKYTDLKRILYNNLNKLEVPNNKKTSQYNSEWLLKNFQHNQIILVNGDFVSSTFSFEAKDKIKIIPLKTVLKDKKDFDGLPFNIPAYSYLNLDLPGQDVTALPAEKLPKPDSRHGVDLIIEELLKSDGDIIIVTIGALTNLAMAITKEPAIRHKIQQIVCMCACFDRLYSEWNIRCDPMAAALVFDSEIPMRIVGLDVTTKCTFSKNHLKKLHDCDNPLAKNLSAATHAWNKEGFPMLHDPLAVATIINPGFVETSRGKATVELQGDETYGYTTFKRNKKGPHEICIDVKPREVIDFGLERIVGN